jgi:RNA polymerase sigma-70 factor (ECF subfamily)
MAEGNHPSYLCTAERLGNDELHALMAEAIRHGMPQSKLLVTTVTPLLIAFFEGQVQAGRVRCEDTQSLVQQTFNALYLGQARYDPNAPFRAWLLEIARATLLHNVDNPTANARLEPFAALAPLHSPQVLQAT